MLQVLQGQVSNHQIAVEKLKKAAEVLLESRGELTPDKDEIQKTLGKTFIFLDTSFYHLCLPAGTGKDKIQFPHSCVVICCSMFRHKRQGNLCLEHLFCLFLSDLDVCRAVIHTFLFPYFSFAGSVFPFLKYIFPEAPPVCLRSLAVPCCE